jgi:hypothetical protein
VAGLSFLGALDALDGFRDLTALREDAFFLVLMSGK